MNINTPPKDFTTLFLDMNSFFASVEQQVRPELRGKPIGVAPFVGDSGCIIAASYEAKRRGVSISRIGEAKKLCPDLQIVEARPALYMIYHKEIRRVIESFTPYFQAMSIDEFVIRLTPREQSREAALALGRELKKAIRERVGDYLSCSVGIGPSKFLAKMAGERMKPDGLTVVELSGLEKFYSEIGLRDITGINFRMEIFLKNFSIDSPLSFFKLSLPRLREILNHPGRLWYFRLRGYEVDDQTSSCKTVGHSHVLEPEFRTTRGAKMVIRKMVLKTGYRLRKEGFWAGGVSVIVRFLNGTEFHLSKRVASFCDDHTLTEQIENLLTKCVWSRPIYVAISTFNLTRNCGEQISLFGEIRKQRDLSAVMDKINDEMGAGTLYPASMKGAVESAPDRIPFGQPRYEIIN